jgi:alpha-D-ribose 1-methylphosphonate 5-phosphate C-P lyase
MKTKTCALCQSEQSVMYRVQVAPLPGWVFVCTSCCKAQQKQAGYRYGGTWKGSRH